MESNDSLRRKDRRKVLSYSERVGVPFPTFGIYEGLDMDRPIRRENTFPKRKRESVDPISAYEKRN